MKIHLTVINRSDPCTWCLMKPFGCLICPHAPWGKYGTTVDITFESNKFKVFQVSIKITNEHQGVTYNDKEFANNNYEEAINKIDVDLLYKYNEALVAIENIRPISIKYQSGKYSYIHPAAAELEQKVTEKKWIEALKRINYYNTLVSGWEESRNAVLKYIGENAWCLTIKSI